MTPLESALSELERLAEKWRFNAAFLESVGSIYPSMQVRVCANDLLCSIRRIRAEHSPEHAGDVPPCSPGVTGRASSSDDARPISYPVEKAS